MISKPLFFVFFGWLMVFTASCGENEEEHSEVYDVRGQYLRMDTDGQYVSVVHETIPGVMDAMRMNLRIEDESVAEDFQQGDIIAFKMTRTDRGWFIYDIEKLPEDTKLELPADF